MRNREKNHLTISITSHMTLGYGIHYNKLLLHIPEKKIEDVGIIKCYNAIENFGTQPECCHRTIEHQPRCHHPGIT